MAVAREKIIWFLPKLLHCLIYCIVPWNSAPASQMAAAFFAYMYRWLLRETALQTTKTLVMYFAQNVDDCTKIFLESSFNSSVVVQSIPTQPGVAQRLCSLTKVASWTQLKWSTLKFLNKLARWYSEQNITWTFLLHFEKGKFYLVKPEGHIFGSRSKSKIVDVNPPSKVNNNTILSAYTNMTHKWDKPCDHRQRDPHQTIRKPPFLKVYRWKLRSFNLHYLQNEYAKIRELNIKQSCEEIPVIQFSSTRVWNKIPTKRTIYCMESRSITTFSSQWEVSSSSTWDTRFLECWNL